MGPFGKYILFGTQLYEIWKPIFNVKNYIFFMHSKPAAFFVPRLPFFFSSCTHHPPLPLSSVKLADRRHHRLPLTPFSGRQSPPFSFSLSSFFLFYSLSTSPREKKAMAMGENQGRREEGTTGCHWRRQPTTLAVIDGGGDGNTSVGRDIEEERVGIPDYGGSMVGSIVYPQNGSFGCVPFEGD